MIVENSFFFMKKTLVMLASIVCTVSDNTTFRPAICLTSWRQAPIKAINTLIFFFDLIHTSKKNHTYIKTCYGNGTCFMIMLL